MGRKRRNTAKTGDVALYKSRDDAAKSKYNKNVEDQDNMYNEVERYHNAKDDLQDDVLKFNSNNQDSEDDSDGLAQQENVFDLGLGDGDDDSSDDDVDSDDSDDRLENMRKAKKTRATNYNESDSDGETPSSDSNDDTDDDDSIDDFEIPETDVLNWGKRKKDYYNGDTADLELGQEVEDAELEEEAGKEVLETRMKDMTEDDFMLDDDDDDDDDKSEKSASDTRRKEKADTLSLAMSSNMQKNLSKLSKREKINLMQKTHPELLPLINHFREEFIRPCVDETLVVANAMFQNKGNAEAVGATNAGLQYLVTKAMLQTSTALNVCQYLLIKAEHAKLSNNNNNSLTSSDDDAILIDSQDEDHVKNHPVVRRLNDFNFLANKIESDIESKVGGLKDQVENLVKASSLMIGDDDENSVGDDDEDSDKSDVREQLPTKLSTGEALEQDDESQHDDDDSSTASSGYEDDALQMQRNVMNEARFSLRTQDDVHLSENDDDSETDQPSRKSKRRRRALPTFTDYGDDDNVDPAALSKASLSLASTVNTISQRRKRAPTASIAEVDDDHNEDRFKAGLEMMEADLGADSDDDIEMNDDDLADSDDADFYSQIKKKSKAKKELKKNMYAVAPKYPGMDDEITGERSVGQMIMKNRGLVAHKSKINRNPRVKKREQYRKAIIRRKGAVRDVRTDEGHRYGGEETGIKSGLSRSRKL